MDRLGAVRPVIYRLHLESGPKKRTTMVHVSNLMGCCVGGPTTDETLEHGWAYLQEIETRPV